MQQLIHCTVAQLSYCWWLLWLHIQIILEAAAITRWWHRWHRELCRGIWLSSREQYNTTRLRPYMRTQHCIEISRHVIIFLTSARSEPITKWRWSVIQSCCCCRCCCCRPLRNSYGHFITWWYWWSYCNSYKIHSRTTIPLGCITDGKSSTIFSVSSRISLDFFTRSGYCTDQQTEYK